tara:strand:- start:80 stop:703 length:624 start_codon:yes stop_codon:yes gene_type:complete
MKADNLSPFFKRVNTLPKILQKIIYSIIWISPFELFVILMYSSTSTLNVVDPRKNESLPKLAAYLKESPLNQLDKSSDLSSLLIERTKELEIIAGPIYFLSILALVSLLSWYFKGAPRNKNRLVNILLNPLLSVIPLSLIQILSIFGSNTVEQIHLLINSDLQMNKFLGLTTYTYANIYSVSLLSYLYFVFVCLVLIIGNKKARNLI